MKKDNTTRKYSVYIVGMMPPYDYLATVPSYKKAVRLVESNRAYKDGGVFRIECRYGNGKCIKTEMQKGVSQGRKHYDWVKGEPYDEGTR